MHRIICTAAQGLAAILLVTLVAACGAPPRVAGPAPTPIPTLIPVAKATATSVPQPAAGRQGQGRGPTRRPAADTTLATFTTADFSGAGLCAACHVGLKDQASADVSMPTAWRSTMMANAARDPIWQAKVSAEVARFPALQGVIEKKCTTCHMPMAVTQAVTEGQPVTAQGEGFFNAANPLHPAAIDGVSCTLCHQIRGENFGKVTSFSGGYTVDTRTNPPDRPIFGPYEQPVAQVMQASTGFNPVYGTHLASAEECATCHNLYTPYVDSQGKILGEFPEQTPYTEWQNSSFGAAATSCQSCHMPQAQGGVVISVVPGNLAARQPFYQHFFVGGNAFMLQILADWGGELEVTADKTHFDTTQARVADQIGKRSASLTLKSLELKDGTLSAGLQVAPLTGHKFPASFPSRRAWLHVTVADAAGRVLFESGQPNADGTIAGNAADSDATAFEPHYDRITQPDQVQIYEPIMGDNEGKVTYTLLRGAKYLKDNRLLPAGADKAKLPADIAVYGEALGDANFVGGGDLVTYQVDVKGAAGPFTFSAELLYEPLSYQFVQDLLRDKTPLTERFGGYYGETDKSPLRVAAIEPVKTK
ncbi:MAG: hypothetical protein NT169_02395 [Chloroflexi bacterium]|nr:hypothetical protein [Chloroflexota bacterium]